MLLSKVSYQITWQKITPWEKWNLRVEPHRLPFILHSLASALAWTEMCYRNQFRNRKLPESASSLHIRHSLVLLSQVLPFEASLNLQSSLPIKCYHASIAIERSLPQKTNSMLRYHTEVGRSGKQRIRERDTEPTTQRALEVSGYLELSKLNWEIKPQ